jgi:hypothetical protein
MVIYPHGQMITPETSGCDVFGFQIFEESAVFVVWLALDAGRAIGLAAVGAQIHVSGILGNTGGWCVSDLSALAAMFFVFARTFRVIRRWLIAS